GVTSSCREPYGRWRRVSRSGASATSSSWTSSASRPNAAASDRLAEGAALRLSPDPPDASVAAGSRQATWPAGGGGHPAPRPGRGGGGAAAASLPARAPPPAAGRRRAVPGGRPGGLLAD